MPAFNYQERVTINKYLRPAATLATVNLFHDALETLRTTKGTMTRENYSEVFPLATTQGKRALALLTTCQKQTRDYLNSIWIRNNPLRYLGYAPDSEINLIEEYLTSLRMEYFKQLTILYFSAISSTPEPEHIPDELIQNAIINVRQLLDASPKDKARSLTESLEAKLIEEFLRLTTLDIKVTAEIKHSKVHYTKEPQFKGRLYKDADIDRYKARLQEIEHVPTVKVQRLNAQGGQKLSQEKFSAAIKKFEEAYTIIEENKATFIGESATAPLATSHSLMVACYEQVNHTSRDYSALATKELQLNELWKWTQITMVDIQAYTTTESKKRIPPTQLHQRSEDLAAALLKIDTQLTCVMDHYLSMVACLETQIEKTAQIHIKNTHRQTALKYLEKAIETYDKTHNFLKQHAIYPPDMETIRRYLLGHPPHKTKIKEKQDSIQEALDKDIKQEEELARTLEIKESEAQAAEEELTRQLALEQEKHIEKLEQEAKEKAKRAQKRKKAEATTQEQESPPLGREADSGEKHEKDKHHEEMLTADEIRIFEAVTRYLETKSQEDFKVADSICESVIINSHKENQWLAEAQSSFLRAHLHMMAVLTTYPPTQESLQSHKTAQSFLCSAYRASKLIDDQEQRERTQQTIIELQEDNNSYLDKQLAKVTKAQAKLEELEIKKQEAIQRFGGKDAWDNNPRIAAGGRTSKAAQEHQKQKRKLKPLADLVGSFEQMEYQSEEFNEECLGRWNVFGRVVQHAGAEAREGNFTHQAAHV